MLIRRNQILTGQTDVRIANLQGAARHTPNRAQVRKSLHDADPREAGQVNWQFYSGDGGQNGPRETTPLGAANRRLALNSPLLAQLYGLGLEVTGKLHSGKALAGRQGALSRTLFGQSILGSGAVVN